VDAVVQSRWTQRLVMDGLIGSRRNPARGLQAG
jgi:hypothetical protein